MIVEPEKYIEQFREAGADVITVHYEACPHLHRTVQQIKATGAKAGVALNPHTPVSVLEDILPELRFGFADVCKSWFWWSKIYLSDTSESAKTFRNDYYKKTYQQ